MERAVATRVGTTWLSLSTPPILILYTRVVLIHTALQMAAVTGRWLQNGILIIRALLPYMQTNTIMLITLLPESCLNVMMAVFIKPGTLTVHCGRIYPTA